MTDTKETPTYFSLFRCDTLQKEDQQKAMQFIANKFTIGLGNGIRGYLIPDFLKKQLVCFIIGQDKDGHVAATKEFRNMLGRAHLNPQRLVSTQRLRLEQIGTRFKGTSSFTRTSYARQICDRHIDLLRNALLFPDFKILNIEKFMTYIPDNQIGFSVDHKLSEKSHVIIGDVPSQRERSRLERFDASIEMFVEGHRVHLIEEGTQHFYTQVLNYNDKTVNLSYSGYGRFFAWHAGTPSDSESITKAMFNILAHSPVDIVQIDRVNNTDLPIRKLTDVRNTYFI